MFDLNNKNNEFILDTLKEFSTNEITYYLYGSRARKKHRKFSDIDIMVESDGDVKKVIRELKDRFEESDLPVKVDVVDIKDFPESYKESYFQDRIRVF